MRVNDAAVDPAAGKPLRTPSRNAGVGAEAWVGVGYRIQMQMQAVGRRWRNGSHGSCYKESSLMLVFISKTLEDTARDDRTCL